MSDISEQQTLAAAWFRTVRDSICAEFEAIEGEGVQSAASSAPFTIHHSPSTFTLTPWSRPDGGSGEMGMMKGRVFEKVGVNISVVHGEFSEAFRKEIPGAESDPRFWAAGISLVAHPMNPHVPAAHMNTRMIVVGGGASRESLVVSREEAQGADHEVRGVRGGGTPPANKLWFGGGGDLNPSIPYAEDTGFFHDAFRSTCDATNPEFYPAMRDWCEEYFFLPHRGMTRGVGGIFYDYLGLNRFGADTSPVTSGRFGKGGANGAHTQAGMELCANAPLDWEAAFAFTQSVGETFRDAYSALVRKRTHMPYTEAEKHAQRVYRGRYAEYNLLYDRGTRFGLMTGGNTEAILMSLPPEAVWE